LSVVRRLALLAVLLSLAACGDDSGDDAQTAVLALDFQPNAVHSGIYAAKRLELDRRNGVELEIRVPSASTDSLKLLAAGRADLAVVDIHDLGLARERGRDVVGVGGLVQRPLAAVIARAEEISRPRELEGRRVGVTGLPSDEALLRAVVEADGGDFERIERVTIGFSAVPTLIAGRVDAVVSFWNVEGVALRQRGVRTREFRVDEFGAPRYPELVLAVERETLESERALLDGLLAAVRAGTRAALSDPAAAVDDIVRASGADEPLVRAELAAVGPALRPPLELDRSALEAWAEFDARFGILESPPDIDRGFSLPAS
jgi:putative hydroxymethylpyrimidine transport system substrate-binding protein